MPIIETARLTLDELTPTDADFIVELLNEEAFLRFIGDKGVRTRADACRYIEEGPRASYARHGHGLYRVSLRADGTPVGMCGLLRRDALEAADLGFALLERHRSRGYGYESASAALAHARETLGMDRVLAITSPDNAVSIGLLEKLGFRFDRMARLAEEEPEVRIFVSDADSG